MMNTERIDRRLFERIPVSLPVRLIDAYSQKEYSAQTHDISATGMGLLTETPLSPQSDLEIWLQIPDRDNPLYTRGKVVWSKQDDAGGTRYRAGIRLEKMEFAGMSFIVERAFPVYR
jgi:c-di-GMP-binding flagellar brake protein YcgR